jgi:molybdate transport system substrate-binding protein
MAINAGKATAVSALVLIGLFGSHASAGEVRLYASAALKPLMDGATAPFESASGHKLIIKYDLTPAVKAKIEAGSEAFDVAVANPRHIDDLIKQGKIAAETRADIARFGVGVGVKAGAPKPDLGSAEALKRALSEARSIAYVGAGTSGAYVASLLEKLGVSDQVKGKLKSGDVGQSLSAVANGEAEIVIMPVPLIRSRQGVELAGIMPPEFQDYIVMSAGLHPAPRDANAAQDLLIYLMAPDRTILVMEKGYDRPAR